MGMLFDGMKRAQLYVVKLIEVRREALQYLVLGSLNCTSCILILYVFDVLFMRLVIYVHCDISLCFLICVFDVFDFLRFVKLQTLVQAGI